MRDAGSERGENAEQRGKESVVEGGEERQSEEDLSRPEIKSSKDDRRDYVRASMSYNVIRLYVNARRQRAQKREAKRRGKAGRKTGEEVSVERRKEEKRKREKPGQTAEMFISPCD